MFPAFVRLYSSRIATRTVKGGLTRSVPLIRPNARLIQSSNGFATAAAATTTTATKTAGKPRATKSAIKKKAPKKAVAKKPKVKKAKKPAVKPKPWEARDANGKQIPLPSASKPKKTSAFILYLKSRIGELKKDQSMLRAGSSDKVDLIKLTTTIGAEWKSLSDAEKKPYQDEAQQLMSVYEAEVSKWRSSLSIEDIRRQNSYLLAQRKKGVKGTGYFRDPAKPKGPSSPFILFLEEYRRGEGAGKTPVQIAKDGAVAWKSLAEDRKKSYYATYEGAKAQYSEDLKGYLASKA